MNYDEIIKALKQGKNVHWINTDYIISHAHNGLYVTFERNGYYTKLQESEYQDCFIGGNHDQG